MQMQKHQDISFIMESFNEYLPLDISFIMESFNEYLPLGDERAIKEWHGLSFWHQLFSEPSYFFFLFQLK
jgi:hypothetical protein